MGFLDSLLGAISPLPEVRISDRLAKFLEFGEWSTVEDCGRQNPCVLVRNISGQAIGHSMLHYSAFTANGGKLTSLMVNLPYLEPGESGELKLPFWMLDDDHWSRTSFVVVDMDEMYDEEMQSCSHVEVIYDAVARQTFEFGEGQWNQDGLEMLITYRDNSCVVDRAKRTFPGDCLHWNAYDRKGVKIAGPESVLMPDLKLGETGKAELFTLGRNMAEIASIEIKIEDNCVGKEAPTPRVGKAQPDLWYYAKNKQRLGPFTIEQMSQLASAGAIQPSDMVLKAGAKQWVQASSIGQLTFSTVGTQMPRRPETPKASIATSDQWYVARNNKKHGPFTAAKLKELAAQGRLFHTDMLHKEGMPKWVPAGSVKGLFAANSGASSPPALSHAPARAASATSPPPPSRPPSQSLAKVRGKIVLDGVAQNGIMWVKIVFDGTTLGECRLMNGCDLPFEVDVGEHLLEVTSGILVRGYKTKSYVILFKEAGNYRIRLQPTMGFLGMSPSFADTVEVIKIPG